MPKAIISNRIYVEAADQTRIDLANKLTYKISNGRAGRFATIETVRTYKIPSNSLITLPQGRQDLIPAGYEIIDKRSVVPAEFPAPKFPLLADQQEVWEQVNDSCFINAKVGWGKTFTALWIAYKFRQKTLIIVHTTSLRDQWVEEVQKLFGFTPDVISQGECNFSTPIVVSNVQTLVKFANGLHKTFGTVVVDESHHTPATTMTAVLDSLSARYRVGLSGTRERKDGKHVLFNDYFGHTVFTPKKNNTLDPIVEVLKTDFKLRGGIPWTTAITELHNDRDYLEFIAEVATVKMNQGHKVLVISERTAALAALTRLLGDRVVAVSGETSKNIRNSLAKDLNSGKHDGIVAMRHVFSEGISVNPLSCLILMSPTPAGPLLEQVIGRIQRLQDGKKHPVIVDIHLTGMPEKRQNSTRLGFYHASGWSITTL